MQLYRVREAAEKLGMSEETLRAWIWKKKIPVVRGPGWVRIREEDIKEFIEKRWQPAQASSSNRKEPPEG
jgi:excisionase family DNA binding protein